MNNSMNEKMDGFNRRALLNKAREMFTFIEDAHRSGLAAHEVEEALFRQVIEMGYRAMGMFFVLCGDGDEGAEIILADGQPVRRLEKLHKREYLSVFGLYELLRVVYGSREGQKIEQVPLDAKLKLPASKFSYLLQDWDQSLIVETPYAKVSETIAKILGLTQSVNSLERINRKMSEAVSAYWDEQPVPPAEEEGALMVCSADGKGVPLRGQGEASTKKDSNPLSAPKKEEKSGQKKVSLVGATYTVDPYKRTPEEVLQALFSDSQQSCEPPPSRPKPLFKHVRASLLRDAADTSKPSYDEIFDWLAQEVGNRNPDGCKPVVFIMDGQESLWNAAQGYLPDITLIEILDLLHVCLYVWNAAHLFFKKKSKAASGFAKENILRILSGDVNRVIRGLRWKGTHEKLSKKRLEKLEKICGYFENNRHRMAYNEYLEAGYPIASGVIEGACRHVVKDRMERSGMRWILDGAHAMLGLRCIHLSGCWDEFTRFRIKRETERLYPG
ncbi:MAG: ISKra4 family transposase, partial [Halobacteria archaeon]|nr:ISKra4 family transposase [Halobacteria archaeon]